MTQGCVSDVERLQGNPEGNKVLFIDALADAVICLGQSESNTTLGDACISDLVNARTKQILKLRWRNIQTPS